MDSEKTRTKSKRSIANAAMGATATPFRSSKPVDKGGRKKNLSVRRSIGARRTRTVDRSPGAYNRWNGRREEEEDIRGLDQDRQFPVFEEERDEERDVVEHRVVNGKVMASEGAGEKQEEESESLFCHRQYLSANKHQYTNLGYVDKHF